MSNFINSVAAKLTGRQYAILTPVPLLDVSEKVVEINTPTRALEYDISVTWGVTVHCLPENLPEMKRNIVAELRDDIYGEFRHKMLLLERAIYEHENREAIEQLRDILREIYQ